MADIATDETSELISSSKVEGTAVYSPEGDKLGTISNFMVNKLSGQVEYAVLQFGGLLGIGSDYYPLPWEVLEYDEDQGGYVIELDKEMLEKAPHYGAGREPVFDNAYDERIYGAYGLTLPELD